MTPKEFRQLILDFKGTFATEEGQRVLDELSYECHENELTYIRNDPNATAFNEGKRFVILHIRSRMATDPNNKKLMKDILESERNTNG